MGIYDRDYYRDGNRGYLANLLPEGGVCKFLIIAQLVVFGLQALSIGNETAVWSWLSLQPASVADGEIWRLVTFGFVHGSLDLWSLAFSLLFLWYFGSDLEQMYGSVEFLCFYLSAMIIGGLAFVATSYLRGAQDTAVLMGAFGTITAVTVLFAWHFPSFTVRMFFILPVPIWLVVCLQVAGSFFLDREQGAYLLAGAAFGSFYYKRQWRLSQVFQGWPTRPRPRGQLRVFHPDDDAEPVAVAAPKPSPPAIDEHLEAKVDAVLEKMARSGKESLSDNERDILLRASEIYRRKRT